MSTFKTLAAFGVVMAASYSAGALAQQFAKSDVLSSVLLTIGALATVTNGFSFQVLRRLDEPPVKNLSERGADRVRRLYDRRRRRFFREWGTAIVTGMVATGAGALLKVDSMTEYHAHIGRFGFAALGITFTLGILIIVQYVALSNLARELPKQLEDEARRNELLRRLEVEPHPGNAASVKH